METFICQQHPKGSPRCGTTHTHIAYILCRNFLSLTKAPSPVRDNFLSFSQAVNGSKILYCTVSALVCVVSTALIYRLNLEPFPWFLVTFTCNQPGWMISHYAHGSSLQLKEPAGHFLHPPKNPLSWAPEIKSTSQTQPTMPTSYLWTHKTSELDQ